MCHAQSVQIFNAGKLSWRSRPILGSYKTVVKNHLRGIERHTTIAIEVDISIIKQQGKYVQKCFGQDNTLRVEVHTTHYGLEKSLGHLRLRDSECAAIAGQLAQGVDFQHILDNKRDSLGREFKRIHLLTRKDITNIEKAYGLKVAQRRADDATSVNMWVTEMMSQEGNPIILYKQQGEPQPLECNYLSRGSEAKSECGGMPRLTSSTLRVRTNNTSGIPHAQFFHSCRRHGATALY